MVYCTKCGSKNEDDVDVCSNCKASLRVHRRSRRVSGDDCFGSRGHKEDACFGLPRGGAIVGLIFGAIIVLVGFALLSGSTWDFLWGLLWPFIIVIFGVLIIGGALYGMRRRR